MSESIRAHNWLLPLMLALMMVPLAPSLFDSPAASSADSPTTAVMLPPEAVDWSAGARSGATSWLREAADEDGDTGRWTSAVSASDGQIWVAYYNAASRDLKAAHWNGWSWSVESVYAFGDVGRFAEIDLDSQGNPRIACFDVTSAVLRISRYDGNMWSTSTVAPGENTGEDNPYAGVGRIGFAIDDTDSEWYSFYVEVTDTVSGYDYNLSFAFWDSNDGNWAYGTIDDGYGERPDTDYWSDIGQFSSMSIGSDGRPRVAYDSEIWQGRDNLDQTVTRWPLYALRHASFDGAGWSITDVHINETDGPVFGYRPARWLDLAIDGNGVEYSAYQYTSSLDSVRLATSAGGSWRHSKINNVSGNLGDYVLLAVDQTGDIHVTY